MSQAEDLLNSLEEEAPVAYSTNPETEPHIVINADKTVVIPEALKRILVQYDHNIETVTFDCPRYWDSHDLSKMNMRIVFQRSDGHREPHPVENLRIDDSDDSMIHFDWTISRNTTLAGGSVTITVCAKITDTEGIPEREWHTIPNRDLFVNEGMDCSSDEIVDENPDIIDSILARLEIAEQGGASDEQIANAVAAYLDENPVQAGAESYSIPDFWTDALNSAIATVKSLQTGKNCVTFAHFSDNHTRLGYSGMLIAEVMKECHIPYCFYNGDSIDSGYIASEDVMIAQDAAFDAAMAYIPEGRFCRAVGNHDGYWAISADEKYTYTRAQNYELFFRKQAAAQNKKFGIDGTYFYVDDLAGQIRFIVLNTNGGSVDDAQIAWFRDVALNVDEGFAVVVISHQPVSNHYHSNISNAAAVREIVADSGVEMIGWFSGHIHRDRIYTGAAVNTTDDTEGDAMGFTQVTITSDHTGIAYDDATKHTVADDDQSHAIDFVTINRDTKTVNLTRLGIGNNRVYSYSDAVLYSITNNLAHVTSSNSVISIEEGNAYSATLTAVSGYELSSVVVTMGGTDITATAYADGVISIAEVTGDVVITATAEAVETEPDTISITWKSGYTCTHAVGSACTETESANYAVSENIPVTEGKTYVLSRSDGEVLISSGKFNLVELDADGIVVQSIEIKYDGLGANTSYAYTPSGGVTQLKFRGYATALEEYQKFVLTIG